MIRLVLLLLTFGAALPATPPNIVFIIADDLGYGDLKALNPDSRIPTPALDSLAADGMTFTDAHSPSSICTPTRYATLTGRYCWRSAMKRGVLNGYGRPFWNGELTIAQHLKESANYHTEAVGKWHLGFGYVEVAKGEYDWAAPLTHSPIDIGFDHCFVIPASLDFPPYVFIEDRRVLEAPTDFTPKRPFPAYLREGAKAPGYKFETVNDQLTEKAVGAVERGVAADGPFFLYFALPGPHKPVLPHPRFRGQSGIGDYGDYVVQMDSMVGEVLKAIDHAGVRDETLVFFTSDNGSFMHRLTRPEQGCHSQTPETHGYQESVHTSNGPLRGTKADIWEAGHRVPFLVRWPGVVEPGSRNDDPICHTDFFLTASHLAGVPVKRDTTRACDSFPLVAHLKSDPEARRGAPVIHHSGAAMFAIRDGKYKLVLGSGSGGRESPRGKRFERPYHLFDLEADLGETENLVDQLPEVAERLEKRMLEIIATGHSF